jgi:hypothetical protein
MSAKTLVTTPNSDVIYAMGYLDLKCDGPMVIEAPPGLQGLLDDFWQRPIRMVGQFEERDWSGDVGLPGPDKGKGGKYLVLPPDYKEGMVSVHFTLATAESMTVLFTVTNRCRFFLLWQAAAGLARRGPNRVGAGRLVNGAKTTLTPIRPGYHYPAWRPGSICTRPSA